MIIYKVKNKINNKIYIGTTNGNLYNRIYEHWKESKRLLGRGLRKYGLQSFEFSIIDSCLLKEIALEKEMYWIKFYNCKSPNGYNLTDGGEGIVGHQHSESTKRKISQALKGKSFSKEHKKKLSEAQKRIGNKPPSQKGKYHSDDTKRKLSEKLKGRHFSEKHKKNMGEAKKDSNNPNWKGGIWKNRIR